MIKNFEMLFENLVKILLKIMSNFFVENVFEILVKFCWKFLNMIKNLKISTRKIEFRKSWKIMCAVAKCKNKKFSLFSTFAVAFSCSLENFILNFVNFEFFQTIFFQTFFCSDFFFHPTF